MKKRIISVMAVLAMLFGPTMMQSAKAQNIFNSNLEMERSLHGEESGEEEDISVNDRESDITFDSIAPLSGGMLVLGCLGGAYLIGKRRKEKNS